MSSATWAPTRGQFLWINFSPIKGNEQGGERPALVLSGRRFNALTGRAMFVPITSTIRGWPFQVLLGPEEPVQGVALVDQARMMSWQARPLRSAGRASDALLEEVAAVLAAIVEI